VEHSCHRCGAKVEDGVPFCAHCGAPQIRVSEAPQSTSGSPTPADPGELPFPAQPVAIPHLSDVVWQRAVGVALFATVLAALVSIVIAVVARAPQLSAVLWMLTGGPLTVALYHRRRIGRVTPRIGAKLGALTGLFGFAISGVLCVLEYVALRGNAELRSALEQQLKQVARSAPDAQQVIEQFLTPHGLSIALILLLVAFPLVSAVGGALTAGLLREGKLE